MLVHITGVQEGIIAKFIRISRAPSNVNNYVHFQDLFIKSVILVTQLNSTNLDQIACSAPCLNSRFKLLVSK